jgi:hypothetical protein
MGAGKNGTLRRFLKDDLSDTVVDPVHLIDGSDALGKRNSHNNIATD